MYRAALDAIGVEPEHVLFVGNRVREDYDGPRSLGLQAVLYTAHNAEAAPSGVRSIARLSELLGLL
jgi:FMN phosphatase YigB (HAD superfamily)